MKGHYKMIKHAYLITAYNNFYTLEKLMGILDDERNDIYIHIDKKVKSFDFNLFSNLCKYSKVIFVPRVKVYWGDYSQIQSIFQLFEQAVVNKYKYYHLLSGADLPIKTQNYIHDFFSKNDGKEFVGFAKSFNKDWISKIYIFNRYYKAQNAFEYLIKWFIRGPFIKLQFNYDRTKKFQLDIKKGSDWFSISHSLVEYMIANKKTTEYLFKCAYIPTEFYMQTLIWNSKFKQNIYDINDEFTSSARYIDWEKGGSSPKVFRIDDFDDLMKSDKLFARKFDKNIDREIIDKIFIDIKERQQHN